MTIFWNHKLTDDIALMIDRQKFTYKNNNLNDLYL